jgi:hypothetical protein
MSHLIEFTRGDTLKSLVATLTQGAAPLDITGGAMTLMASSSDIATTISMAGAIVDGPAGECEFSGVGNQLSDAHMGARNRVVFRAQVRYVNGGVTGFSRVFSFAIARPVVGA